MGKIYEALESAHKDRLLRVVREAERAELRRTKSAPAGAPSGNAHNDRDAEPPHVARPAQETRKGSDGRKRNARAVDPELPESQSRPDGRLASHFEEAAAHLYRPIVSRLTDSRGLVAFVGAHEGVGTTTMAREFAQFLADQGGHSTLLLDANSKRPRQLSHYGMVCRATLGEAAAAGNSPEQALHRLGNSGLSLAGVAGGSSAHRAIFGSPRLQAIMMEMRKRFDMVVADCPALGDAPETEALCAEADGVILVVQAGRTRAHQAAWLKERVELAGGRCVGLVLNFRGFTLPRWLAPWIGDRAH